eukprot:1368618-Prymnesium_polylepis.1
MTMRLDEKAATGLRNRLGHAAGRGFAGNDYVAWAEGARRIPCQGQGQGAGTFVHMRRAGQM